MDLNHQYKLFTLNYVIENLSLVVVEVEVEYNVSYVAKMVI